MHPHTALSLALMGELNRERTRVVRPGSRRLRTPHLRAVRHRRAARPAAAGC